MVTHFPRLLITGASSGLGRELAIQLAQRGVSVVALGRDRERLASLAGEGPNIATVVADLADRSTLPALALELSQRFPDLGGVIHNAAIQHNRRFDDGGYHPSHVAEELDTNLLAPIVLTRALLPHLQRCNPAWVVFITSGLAFVPKRSAAVYSASKAGLHLFCEGLRAQLGGSSIHLIEAVMPLLATPMTEGRGQGKMSAAHAAKAVIEGMATGRSPLYIGKARALPWLLRWMPWLAARVIQRG